MHLTSVWPYPDTNCPPYLRYPRVAAKNIRVLYYAGYPVGELPGDIEQLVLDLTARNWLDRGKENLKSEKIGDSYSYTRMDSGSGSSGGLTRQQEDTIALWRGPVFA